MTLVAPGCASRLPGGRRRPETFAHGAGGRVDDPAGAVVARGLAGHHRDHPAPADHADRVHLGPRPDAAHPALLDRRAGPVEEAVALVEAVPGDRPRLAHRPEHDVA